MKALLRTVSLVLFLVSLLPSILGQEPTHTRSLAGIWKWTFTMPDGSQVTPKLELKEEAGQLTGTTRLRHGTEAPITNLTVNGSQITFQVVRERDGQEAVTQYTGILSSNIIKGKIVSNWGGAEESYDWEAHRSLGASGTWKWISTFGTFRSQSTLTLKQEGEKLTGKLNSGRGGDADIKKGKIQSGEISFHVERERDGETYISRYHGKLSGDKIVGKMVLNFFGEPRTNKWEAVRVD
jgi:hypothetical protein